MLQVIVITWNSVREGPLRAMSLPHQIVAGHCIPSPADFTHSTEFNRWEMTVCWSVKEEQWPLQTWIFVWVFLEEIQSRHSASKQKLNLCCQLVSPKHVLLLTACLTKCSQPVEYPIFIELFFTCSIHELAPGVIIDESKHTSVASSNGTELLWPDLLERCRSFEAKSPDVGGSVHAGASILNFILRYISTMRRTVLTLVALLWLLYTSSAQLQTQKMQRHLKLRPKMVHCGSDNSVNAGHDATETTARHPWPAKLGLIQFHRCQRVCFAQHSRCGSTMDACDQLWKTCSGNCARVEDTT